MPASEKDPEGWGATDKFTVVLETAGLNATELSAYCRERGLYPEHVERLHQASQDANEKPVLTLKEQKELERLRAQDQKEIKRLKQELRREQKALADAAELMIAGRPHFRDEFLNTELFSTAPEAQLLADRWRWESNTFRPHSALQGRTPWRQLNHELQHEHNYPLS